MNPIKEQFILWQIRKGKKEAFSQIYDAYNQQIHRYIEYRLPSPEDADDITSQVFFKCFEYLQDAGRAEVRHLKAFLYRLARNMIADFYRSARRQEVSVADPALYEGVDQNHIVSADDVEHEYVRRQRLVENSLQDLKQEYREVILMRYIDGMAIEEIAHVLEKSEGTVRVLLYRAREALKKQVIKKAG